ncbi:MAG: hypothetical protein ACXABD_16045, partial [Candidatus Thorarchaeota archaeon]
MARVRMHTDASLGRSNQTQAYTNWLGHIDSISDGDPDKLQFFKQLIKFPLVTTSVTSNVYRGFKRVFHGADSRRDFQFQNADFEPEFSAFVQMNKGWFETEG